MWNKFEMPKGTFWWRVEGPVMESVGVGEFDESNPAVLTRELDRMHAEQGWCGAFHDWDRITGYSTRFRVDWIRWATSPAARAARFTHFRLGNSPLLKMAVSVASVAFSGQQFIVHPTSAAFAAARAQYMSRPERIPEFGAIRV